MVNEMSACQSCNGGTTSTTQPDYSKLLILGFAAVVGTLLITKEKEKKK